MVPVPPEPASRLERRVRGLRIARILVTGTWIRLTLLLALAGCGGETTHTTSARISDSAGVRIVENTGQDSLLGWSFRRRVVLGGEENGVASFTRLFPGQVTPSATGGLAVLDNEHNRLVFFDSTGAWSRTLGRRGGGPGEFVLPFQVTIDPAGTTWVMDAGKSAFVRFDPGGNPLPEIRTTLPGPQAVRALAGDTMILLDRVDNRRTLEQYYRLAVATEGDTTLLAESPVIQARDASFASCHVAYAAAPVFASFPIWAAAAGRVASVMTPEYVADIYRDGHLALSIRRNITPKAATLDLARRELGDGQTMQIGQQSCTIPPEEIAQQTGMAPEVPVLKGAMAFAPDGTLWIQRHTFPDEARRVDLFRPDGAYLGTVENAPAPLAFLPSGDIITIEKDSLGVQRVAVYRRDERKEKTTVD